jgi:hypothetical protein
MKHSLVERTVSIDVGELNRDGAFSEPPKWFPFLGLKTRRFKIEYRGYRWPRERSTQIIPVTWTRCHFGGRRPWFVCRCGKRAAKLYSGVLGLFGCRQCSEVAYQSQLWGRKRRLYRKAQEIRRRLWNEGRPGRDALPTRPPRMHRKTYGRFIATLENLEWELRKGGAYRPKSRRVRDYDAPLRA